MPNEKMVGTVQLPRQFWKRLYSQFFQRHREIDYLQAVR